MGLGRKDPLSLRVATFPVFTAMAGLSQDEINAHLLGKRFKTFRTTFESKYLKNENVDLAEIVDQFTSKASDAGEKTTQGITSLPLETGEKDVLFDFVLIHQVQPAARSIGHLYI